MGGPVAGRTLAELRARKPKSLPTHVMRITLEQELIADTERLEMEKSDLMVEFQRTDAEGERTGPPLKAGVGKPKRVVEIDEELRVLYDKIRESEGELLLRGITGGDWQAWKDDHPPRPENVTDLQVTYGLCNASELLEDLDQFVTAWNGEDLADGDWNGWLKDAVAAGDLRDMVTAVVAMQERSGVRVPKSLTVSSQTGPSETD